MLGCREKRGQGSKGQAYARRGDARLPMGVSVGLSPTASDSSPSALQAFCGCPPTALPIATNRFCRCLRPSSSTGLPKADIHSAKRPMLSRIRPGAITFAHPDPEPPPIHLPNASTCAALVHAPPANKLVQASHKARPAD